MKNLIFYTRLYVKILHQYIKIRMQYRVDFLIGLVGMIFQNFIAILSLWVLFHSISGLAGYSYDELLFMYGFTLLTFVPLQLFFDNIWSLRYHLAEGSFLKYYFKPLNMMFYYMSEVFDIKGIGQLILGIITIVYASGKLHIQWDFGKICVLLSLLLCGSLVMLSLMLIAGFSAFWIINSFSIMNFMSKLKDFARYPLTIFNNIFKFIFTLVIPIGFISYYPLQLFFKPQGSSFIVFFSPIIGILLFILAYQVWRKGINTYSGTGS